jgi:hypothetical protein
MTITTTTSTTTTTTPPSYYKVYLTESLGGGARNHMAIFITDDLPTTSPLPTTTTTTSSSLPPNLPSGTIYNTTGTILAYPDGSGGQTYEVRPTINPQYTPEHIPGTFRCIGRIRGEENLGKFVGICEDVEVPGPQVDLRGRVLVPGRRVRRCTEWVEEVVEAARGEGVIVGEEEEEEEEGS